MSSVPSDVLKKAIQEQDRYDEELRDLILQLPKTTRIRIANAFINHGVRSVSQLREIPISEMRKWKNFGATSLAALQKCLGVAPLVPSPMTLASMPSTRDHAALIAYLLSAVRRRDWHAVSDAANDLRVLEAQRR